LGEDCGRGGDDKNITHHLFAQKNNNTDVKQTYFLKLTVQLSFQKIPITTSTMLQIFNIHSPINV